MAEKQQLARLFLLIGGGIFLFLLAATVLNILAAPLAALVLLASVVGAAILLARRVMVGISIAAGIVLLAAAITWWIAWGNAFDYADANQTVPAALNLVQLVSGIAATTAGIAVLAAWVTLLIPQPSDHWRDRLSL